MMICNMRKLTLTILHKLPNRVRFRLSHSINDTKKFFETIKVETKYTFLRYNRTINTILVKFDPEEISIDEVIYRTATALSVEHGMTSVRLVEDFEEKSIDSFSIYSGAAILLSFLYSLGKSKVEKLQIDINNFAAGLTTVAIMEHAYKETQRKGFFDIEILPALYLLKSYLANRSVTAVALMWLTTFGRHLVLNNFSNKEVRIYRLKADNGKFHYVVDVKDDNSIENLSDLIDHIFFNNKTGNESDDKYIALK